MTVVEGLNLDNAVVVLFRRLNVDEVGIAGTIVGDKTYAVDRANEERNLPDLVDPRWFE